MYTYLFLFYNYFYSIMLFFIDLFRMFLSMHPKKHLPLIIYKPKRAQAYDLIQHAMY